MNFLNINYYIYIITKITKKIEKKFKITLFFISIPRIIHFLIELFLLKKIDEHNFFKVSNYFLEKTILQNNRMTIISGGIGHDASFENELINFKNVEKIICIDPTKIGKQTIQNLNSQKVFFEKKVLFNSNDKVKVFKPFEEINNFNFSIKNLYETKNFEYIEAIDATYLKNKYSLNNIDLLKLDIEGVADVVIIDFLTKGFIPNQICFELERPISILKQFGFFCNFVKLCSFLKKHYDLYRYTEIKIGYRSEIIAVLKKHP